MEEDSTLYLVDTSVRVDFSYDSFASKVSGRNCDQMVDKIGETSNLAS